MTTEHGQEGSSLPQATPALQAGEVSKFLGFLEIHLQRVSQVFLSAVQLDS